MPGAGKTTLGRGLADALLLPFIDLDQEIETNEGASVPEIFSKKGEDYFRRIESQMLNEWAAKREDFVMATGGGAPCFYNGIETMNTTGLTIFLDVSLDELVRRTVKTDRPLLRSADSRELKDKLRILAEKRSHVYSKASIVAKEPTVESVLYQLKFRS
jgi:shikimate kinase